MSVRRLAPDAVQPASFAFTKANDNWADGQIAKYPPGRQASAVIPLLWKAQEQHDGWLPRAAIEAVAAKLGMAPMRVLEVATFYTMFNLAPVGEHFVQVCGTVPCHLCGARDLIKVCEEKIGPSGTVTADGKLSWLEVECLGACCNAPMAQINFDYYEDLTPENFGKLLDDLRSGKAVKTGSQTGRSCSEPLGGGTTLKDKALYDGSAVGKGDWQKRIKADRAAAAKAAQLAAQAAAAAASAPPPGAPPAAAPVAPMSAAKAAPARPKSAARQPTSAAQDTPAAGGAAIRGSAVPAKAATPVSAMSGPPASSSRPTGSKAAPARRVAVPAAKTTPTKPTAPAADPKPELLKAPRGGKGSKGDDLSLIWGVGPKLHAMLNSMGVWHFDQIAAWTKANLKWVDANLEGFKGRAERDDWIKQAKKLAKGWRPTSKVGDKPVK
jgi:NADH-quinone oxidoreductase subunit E